MVQQNPLDSYPDQNPETEAKGCSWPQGLHKARQHCPFLCLQPSRWEALWGRGTIEVGIGEGHAASQKPDTLGHAQQHAREYNMTPPRK